MTRTRTTTRLAAVALAAVLTTGGALLSSAPAFADDDALPDDPGIEQQLGDEEGEQQLGDDPGEDQGSDEAGGDGGGDILFSPMSDPLLEMEVGTVSITGTPQVGNTLTAVVADWPEGATLSYQWAVNGGMWGDELTGETAITHVVTSEYVGAWIGVIVTAELEGYEEGWVLHVLDDPIWAPKEEPSGAPVNDSSGLAGFLSDAESTPGAADSVGLPTAPLSPGRSYTGTFNWLGFDSWVDVYAYSTPTYVGTFPVIDGVVQFSLGSSVLSRLSGGTHTLVVIGQSSGTVASARFDVARTLASTGVEVGPASFALAGGMLVLGAAAFAMRRRATATA
ncbi:LPXTG cell wall anchor domain-containing protein [Salinibacterium sp. ZJ70]|uniref:LPXTG cell wall anchor domain-containing protein n=1 Tax=Salinibacterium sp. ZJ70 TaxID=2708084 RepID=UPI00141E1C48|nr:LPXTG cell wall anchor domain-containing protein [Salinibacterium sp. ZJ70]